MKKFALVFALVGCTVSDDELLDEILKRLLHKDR